MLFHPLSITVLLLDLTSLVVLFAAFRTSLPFLLGNTMDDGGEARISPGRVLCVLQCVSFLLLILGISLIFPPILTGIMCGTGVLKISGEAGIRMLLVKLCALLALFVWYQLDLARREFPGKDMEMNAARGMMVSVPFVVLGVWLSAETLWLLNVGVSGDCCSLAYGSLAAGSNHIFNPAIWLFFLIVLSVVLLLAALCVIRTKGLSHRLVGLTGCYGIVWCLPASICLLYYFSAYYYGVSQHPCFWCLFLPGNYCVGYPLFIAMGIVVSQSVAILLYGRLAFLKPQLSGWMREKIRKSVLWLIVGIFVYFLLTIGPAIIP